VAVASVLTMSGFARIVVKSVLIVEQSAEIVTPAQNVRMFALTVGSIATTAMILSAEAVVCVGLVNMYVPNVMKCVENVAKSAEVVTPV